MRFSSKWLIFLVVLRAGPAFAGQPKTVISGDCRDLLVDSSDEARVSEDPSSQVRSLGVQGLDYRSRGVILDVPSPSSSKAETHFEEDLEMRLALAEHYANAQRHSESFPSSGDFLRKTLSGTAKDPLLTLAENAAYGRIDMNDRNFIAQRPDGIRQLIEKSQAVQRRRNRDRFKARTVRASSVLEGIKELFTPTSLPLFSDSGEFFSALQRAHPFNSVALLRDALLWVPPLSHEEFFRILLSFHSNIYQREAFELLSKRVFTRIEFYLTPELLADTVQSILELKLAARKAFMSEFKFSISARDFHVLRAKRPELLRRIAKDNQKWNLDFSVLDLVNSTVVHSGKSYGFELNSLSRDDLELLLEFEKNRANKAYILKSAIDQGLPYDPQEARELLNEFASGRAIQSSEFLKFKIQRIKSNAENQSKVDPFRRNIFEAQADIFLMKLFEAERKNLTITENFMIVRAVKDDKEADNLVKDIWRSNWRKTTVEWVIRIARETRSLRLHDDLLLRYCEEKRGDLSADEIKKIATAAVFETTETKILHEFLNR